MVLGAAVVVPDGRKGRIMRVHHKQGDRPLYAVRVKAEKGLQPLIYCWEDELTPA